MRELEIDGVVINDDSDCYVIAEIGHNHQGSVDTAKKLLLAAKQAGANAAKLQKRDNRSLYTAAMYNKAYDHENSFGRTYGEHREFLEFGEAEYRDLQAYARELGLALFATAFDMPSADLLARLDMPAFKIASGDLRNTRLLRHVAAFGKPVIVSTGGGTMDDVQRAYDVIAPLNAQVCFLQCTATYPSQPEEMNLRVIATLRERFPESVVGLSDHYNGIALSVVAYMLGARILEKHFTLNHTWKGTDHAFSLEPIGMHKMVRDLQRARISLGDGCKRPLPAEASALLKMGKKLVAARALPAGHVLTPDDIALKSPGDGLPAYEFDRMLGRRTKVSLGADENLAWDQVEEAADR
jgi:N-acetylneuraminate synthase/sialic acid synthase